jgi:hypothetical protein
MPDSSIQAPARHTNWETEEGAGLNFVAAVGKLRIVTGSPLY